MNTCRSYSVLCLTLISLSIYALPQRGAKRKKQASTVHIAQPKQVLESRTIEIATHITDKTLEYSHWTGTYSPNTFLLKIDNNEIPLRGEKTCTLSGDTLTVRYDYMFMNGYRKGAKEVTYRIAPNTKKVEISFDWNSKWRIIVNNADPVDIKEVPYSA